MKRGCTIILNGCPGVDSPITNISAEAPDPFLWASVSWGNEDPYRPRNLGNGPQVHTDCHGINYSALSQEMADLLALLASSVCGPPGAVDIPGVPPLPPPPEANIPDFMWTPPEWNPPGSLLQPFTNSEITESVSCPDGSTFTATIEAGVYVAYLTPAVGPAWVLYVNAWLHAMLLQQLADDLTCMTVPNAISRTEPGTPPVWWPPIYPWPPDPTPPSDYPPDNPWPPTNPNQLPPSLQPAPSSPLLSNYHAWCCLGETLDVDLQTYVVGGTKSYTFSISDGALPPGTSLVQIDDRSAAVIGTPTAAGLYTYTVKATATTGTGSVSVQDTLHVYGLTTGDPTDGEVNDDTYNFQFVSAGGTGAVTFAVTSGALPPGLSMTDGGLITGNPSLAGPFAFTVTFTDAQGGQCSKSCSLYVEPEVIGPDWDDLLWGVPVLAHTGAATSSFTPDSTTSAVFVADCETPNNNGNYSNAQNSADIDYVDGPFNCNLHIDLTNIAVDNRTFGNVLIYDNGVLIYTYNYAALASGVYNFPFVLPDTGGVVHTIHITVTIQAASYLPFQPSGYEHIHIEGVFSTIP